MNRACFVVLVVVVAVACSRSDSMPNYPVRLEFNISANAPQLAGFNSYKEFIEPLNANQRLGLGGVVVFHSVEDKFYAFDMACPYEKKSDVRIACSNIGLALCSSCGSQFYLADGTGFVQKGLAKYSLQKYSVYYDEAMGNILVVN